MAETVARYYRHRRLDGTVKTFKCRGLNATLNEIKRYNKKHNTHLNYGEYMGRKYNGWL